MSTLLTSQVGDYTVTIEDVNGNASVSDLTPRMGPLQVKYGEHSGGRGSPITPSEFSVILKDTASRDIRETFTGNFDERNYRVQIDGPRRSSQMDPFRWVGFVKSQGRTKPLSVRTHPEKIRLTFYDGLSRLKREPIDFDAVELSSIGGSLFSVNNDIAEVFVFLACNHKTGPREASFSSVDLNSLRFAQQDWDDPDTKWDLLDQFGRQYQCRIYLAPYDWDDTSNLPRFHVCFRGAMGQSVEGLVGSLGPAGISSPGSTTVAADVLDVRDRDLTQSGGEEFEDASVFLVREELPQNESVDDPALVMNGNNAFRDGDFQYETDSGNEPLYGTINGSVTVAAGDRIQIHQDNTIGTSWYRSRHFRTGTATPLFAFLEYSVDILDFGSSVTVTLQHRDDDGNVTVSTSGDENDSLLKIEITDPGQIEVYIESDGCNFGPARMRVYYRDDPSQVEPPEDLQITDVTHQADQKAFLEVDTGPFTDVIGNLSYDPGPGITRAPISRYEGNMANLDIDAATAGEWVALAYEALQPAENYTLESVLRNQILSPRTRIEHSEGDFVIGSGRTMDLRGKMTRISDIQVPDFT